MSKISNEIVIIDPRDIVVEAGFNTRYNEDLKPLQATIKAVGVLEPIHVREDKDGNIILASQGHRRVAATLALIHDGITKADNGVSLLEVPARYEGEDTTVEERNLLIVIGNSGKPLEVLEQGDVFKRVRDNAEKLSAGTGDAALKKAAAETGLNIVHVRNVVALAEQTEPTLRKVRADKISGSAVIEVIIGIRADFPKLATAELADRVEAKVLKLVAKADETGKKVSKSDAKKEKQVIDPAIAKAAEEADKLAKARREEEKAELKRLKGIVAKVEKLGAWMETKESTDEVATAAWNVLGAAYNYLNGLSEAKLSDIEGEVKTAQAKAKESLKAAVKAAKEGTAK